jgi:hypothetical protein
MAISINKVYRTVLSIMNKEGRGFLTPDQFNRIGREVQLDAVYLKKMGLTKKRMEDCDALFLNQLLVPIANPAFSGIKTNQYTYRFKQ